MRNRRDNERKGVGPRLNSKWRSHREHLAVEGDGVVTLLRRDLDIVDAKLFESLFFLERVGNASSENAHHLETAHGLQQQNAEPVFAEAVFHFKFQIAELKRVVADENEW